MEIKVEEYKDYIIATQEGVQKGIFFRSPLQRVSFDAYGDVPDVISAWKYLRDIKNPIRRFYEILIGNREIVSTIHQMAERCDWGGFDANILCSPIYFKREYRKLSAYSCIDSNIKRIESYGYEGIYNICAGECKVERTKVYIVKRFAFFSNTRIIRLKKFNQYYYTYAHIAKEVIDSGCVEGD